MNKINIFVLFVDIIVLCVSALLSTMIRLEIGQCLEYLSNNHIHFIIMGSMFILSYYIADLYSLKRYAGHSNQIITIIAASIMSVPIYSLIVYLFQIEMIGRSVFFLNGIIVTIGIALWRLYFNILSKKKFFKLRTVVTGLNGNGKKFIEDIKKLDRFGIEFLGVNDPEELEEHALKHSIDQIIVAGANGLPDKLINLFSHLILRGTKILHIPEFYQEYWQKIPLEYVSRDWLYHEFRNKKLFSPYPQNIKRLVDIFLAISGLIITLPLYLPIFICIKLNSRGPVFYLQERLGKDGKPFTTIKFRSMVHDAEKNTGVVWSQKNDPRITGVGKLLRETRLDELPQFINVLKGEMSFVGPRPERSEFINHFIEKVPAEQNNLDKETSHENIPFYSMRLLLKPGITGWAQVNYGYVNSTEGTREKLEYDLYYILNQSFFMDISILLKSIRIVLLGKGI